MHAHNIEIRIQFLSIYVELLVLLFLSISVRSFVRPSLHFSLPSLYLSLTHTHLHKPTHTYTHKHTHTPTSTHTHTQNALSRSFRCVICLPIFVCLWKMDVLRPLVYFCLGLLFTFVTVTHTFCLLRS